eukprot:gene14563-biopygen8109
MHGTSNRGSPCLHRVRVETIECAFVPKRLPHALPDTDVHCRSHSLRRHCILLSSAPRALRITIRYDGRPATASLWRGRPVGVEGQSQARDGPTR